jgi:carbonic anhydrase/acetyltransferase-like protein (isoleucine patch superfamily)
MSLYSLGERSVELRGADHYIAPSASLIGAIVLEADVSVWFNVAIRADNDRIHIGEASNVQDGAVLHVDPGFPMAIGRHVTVGHKAMLHGCTIGDGVLVGVNSVILNGAKIGKGTLVGANTLIAPGKEIPEGVLVLGSPGKVVRPLNDAERALLELSWRSYVERARSYRTQLREQPLPDSAR